MKKPVPLKRWALVAAVLSVGCVPVDEEATPAWSIVDSAGVRLVTTHRLEWEGVREWSGTVQLSVPHGPTGPDLSYVANATVLPDGRVAVLDVQEESIFLFSEDGTFLGSLGRWGQGPGEFTALISILNIMADGAIQVFDRSLRRVTTFGSDGSVDQILTLRGPGFEPGEMIQFAWMVDDERVLVWEHVESEQGPVSRSSEAVRWVVPGRLRLVNLASGNASTLYEASARDWIVEGSRWWVAPFGPRTTLSFESGRLYASPGTSHEVSVIEPDSGRIATYRYPAADRPFSLDRLAALEAEALQEAREGGYSYAVGALFSPEIQPPMHPAIQRIHAAPDGSVWAHVHGPPQQHSPDWWVIGAEGRFRGMVRLPGKREILRFTDSLAVILSRDDLDVPTVEFWSLDGAP